MIMKNKYIFLLFLSVFGVFVFSPLEAVAKKKKKGKKSLNPFRLVNNL
jgi:hypothetical protein